MVDFKTLSFWFTCTFGLICSFLMGCHDLLPSAPLEEDLLDGPVEGLTPDQSALFIAGDIAFNDEVFIPESGLGPIFVATSCGSCHAGDGKGHPFTTLTRFGQPDAGGNKFLNQGGPQLQHRAIPGYRPEAIPAGATFTKLLPPANTGLGFIELIPDSDILARHDPTDVDGDGISGRVNLIDLPDYVTPHAEAITMGGKYIGRFGKKAAVYNLLQQTANAYNQDIGITSTFEPIDTYSGLVIDPEISDKTINEVVFYLQTLKAPVPRAGIIEGKNLMETTGCTKCHVPQFQTTFSSVAALSHQIIYPYTDLLLHDMGPELDDGYTEGSALTSEWRTPPLWGLGLSKNSQGGKYFLMHDGRAKSIEEAILLHGGEGQSSKATFEALSAEEKKQLIQFLESL